MKNKFSSFKFSSLIANLIIGLAYPIIKSCIAERNKLIVFSDTCLIIAGGFIIFGVFTSLYLHGDFDVTTYIAGRTFKKNRNQTYEKYKKDKDYERKGSFNYPLLTGIILLLTSFITSLFC